MGCFVISTGLKFERVEQPCCMVYMKRCYWFHRHNRSTTTTNRSSSSLIHHQEMWDVISSCQEDSASLLLQLAPAEQHLSMGTSTRTTSGIFRVATTLDTWGSSVQVCAPLGLKTSFMTFNFVSEVLHPWGLPLYSWQHLLDFKKYSPKKWNYYFIAVTCIYFMNFGNLVNYYQLYCGGQIFGLLTFEGSLHGFTFVN